MKLSYLIKTIIIVVMGIVITVLLMVFVPRSDKYINYRLNKLPKLFMQGKEAEAEQIIQRIIKRNPDCGKALRALGVCYMMRKDLDKSMYYLKQAVDVGDSEELYMLAGMYVKTGQVGKIGEIVPALMEYRFKDSRNLMFVLRYSMEINNKELFESALKDVPPEYIKSDELLTEVADRGCKFFRTKSWKYRN